MQSLWSQKTPLSSREELKGDISAKNVVIGAGMAGILIAYFLKKRGQEVIVLEAGELASGQTKNTTAKITSQHGLIYKEMIKNTGRLRAEGYARANEEAILAYEKIIEEEQIDCHFERIPSYLYSTREEGRELLKLEEMAALELGIKAHYIEGTEIQELPFQVTGALCFEDQAQFYPLDFISKISEGIQIYEHTKVVSVKKHEIYTEKGKVTAENIIFAAHYPFLIIPGFYFIRQHQSRSYVLALEGKRIPEKLSGMYYGIDDDGLSFRGAGSTLLLGGGSHRTGEERGGFCDLRNRAREYYPHATEIACWSAQDCMPHDRIPFIGQYSIWRPYWYIATGFQKWGMTSSMVAAMVISDAICKRDNTYRQVFTPQRLLIKAGFKNLCTDLIESVVGLAKGWLGPKEKRCTHMGCGLIWNEEEKTWECPCHGSRYDAEGELLDNPARRDMETKHLVGTRKK